MRRLRMLAAITSAGLPCAPEALANGGADEAGAGTGEIDGAGTGKAEPMGDERRTRRQQIIGRGSGEQHQAKPWRGR